MRQAHHVRWDEHVILALNEQRRHREGGGLLGGDAQPVHRGAGPQRYLARRVEGVDLLVEKGAAWVALAEAPADGALDQRQLTPAGLGIGAGGVHRRGQAAGGVGHTSARTRPGWVTA
ncbi:MAG: hypothetical protein U0531_11995 [Dehalococcoidia bacterium]